MTIDDRAAQHLRWSNSPVHQLSTEQLVELVTDRLRNTSGQALPESSLHDLAHVAFDKLLEQTP